MHLVVFKLGGMGDLLMVMPGLRGLRESFPAARISFIVGQSNRQVLVNCPYVDQLLTVDDRAIFTGHVWGKVRHTWKLLRLIRRLHADVAFILHRDWRWNLVFFLAGVSRRYGFARDFRGAFLTDSVSTTIDQHEIHKYQAVFGLFPGYEPDGLTMELFPDDDDRAVAETILAKTSAARFLAVAPGGAANVKESRAMNRWPLANYQGLIKRVLAETDLAVLLIGGPGDRELTGFLSCDDRVMDLAGRLTLPQSYLVLQAAVGMITHDGGPMHLAAAAGIPVISLFGPTRPLELAPVTRSESIWLWKGQELSCAPCYLDGKFPDCRHQDCMKRISVGEVLEHVHRLLAQDQPRYPNPPSNRG